jgi:hypothetical protein
MKRGNGDDSSPKPKRASGGARAWSARRAEADANRQRAAVGTDVEGAWLRAYLSEVGEPPKNPKRGFEWLSRALLFACHQTMIDPGLPVERRREQLSRLASAAVKALEPAGLNADLEKLYQALTSGDMRRAFDLAVAALDENGAS